jgi:hypothetical protein
VTEDSVMSWVQLLALPVAIVVAAWLLSRRK